MGDLKLDGDAVGAWLHLPGSAPAELIGSVGFDFVCIDLQHGVIDDVAVLPMLQAIAATGTPTMVRVQTNAPELICRALDRGADGVVVPLVDSADEAAAAVAACRYPPRGVRSYGPVRAPWHPPRAEPVCVVMVETPDAVAALPDILGVEGVGGVLIGPSDLALSHGMPVTAQHGDGAYDALVRAIVELCRAAKTPVGIFTASPEHARRFRAVGVTFVAGPTDADLLRAAAVEHLARCRP
ncbi:MAG: 2,4-dihydroxyhept-2-ene-1,7-dioic acid aldolase [Pseudonocardia sp.]|nr:2,4-dihydroxyhept-2-ene-1,7-dioic acid aldolase [Pseudonocardia sp.]